MHKSKLKKWIYGTLLVLVITSCSTNPNNKDKEKNGAIKDENANKNTLKTETKEPVKALNLADMEKPKDSSTENRNINNKTQPTKTNPKKKENDDKVDILAEKEKSKEESNPVKSVENSTEQKYVDENGRGLIKGNINKKGEKIYHMPNQRDYKKTKINTSKGERYFKTESEAKKAGWRKALR